MKDRLVGATDASSRMSGTVGVHVEAVTQRFERLIEDARGAARLVEGLLAAPQDLGREQVGERLSQAPLGQLAVLGPALRKHLELGRQRSHGEAHQSLVEEGHARLQRARHRDAIHARQIAHCQRRRADARPPVQLGAVAGVQPKERIAAEELVGAVAGEQHVDALGAVPCRVVHEEGGDARAHHVAVVGGGRAHDARQIAADVGGGVQHLVVLGADVRSAQSGRLQVAAQRFAAGVHRRSAEGVQASGRHAQCRHRGHDARVHAAAQQRAERHVGHEAFVNGVGNQLAQRGHIVAHGELTVGKRQRRRRPTPAQRQLPVERPLRGCLC
mmetsp:Transcript_6152/g.18737  ORF Transcript_6152/g.18737 Transcript_6152/m.18737 type:complete len:329 (-) Transcript_6152:41-1027(-)